MDTFTATMNQIQADLDLAVARFEAVVTERTEEVLANLVTAINELTGVTAEASALLAS